MEESIIIAGAGMGGLAAGIYGRLNGCATTIFEQQTLPGGQCASWKRRGALFSNALSGRKVMRTLCKADGRKFVTG
jgi:phytoene dehydrogenase-like protein